MQTRDALRASNERFERLVQASSDSILELDLQTNSFQVSEGFTRSFGHQLPGPEQNRQFIQSLVHPDDRQDMINSFNQALANPEVIQREYSYRLRKLDGDYARVVDHLVILRDSKGKAYRTLGTIRDITREFVYRSMDELENRIMVRMMEENPARAEILDQYMEELEQLFPLMKASIMEIRGERLHTLAAPSLPVAYCDAIEGMEIGARAGSCGTAAWLGEPVLVSNVLADERWEDFVHLARQYQFRACWSCPIRDSQGEVVATFASYYLDERQPSELDLAVMERTQQLIGLILERYRFLHNLQQSNERYQLISLSLIHI